MLSTDKPMMSSWLYYKKITRLHLKLTIHVVGNMLDLTCTNSSELLKDIYVISSIMSNHLYVSARPTQAKRTRNAAKVKYTLQATQS